MNEGKEKKYFSHSLHQKDQVMEITEKASIFSFMFSKSKTWEQIQGLNFYCIFSRRAWVNIMKSGKLQQCQSSANEK